MAYAVAELRKRGVSNRGIAPFLWRLCWRCGVPVPPPLFGGFAGLVMMTYLSYLAGASGPLLAVVFLLDLGLPVAALLLGPLGLLLSLIRAEIYFHRARRLHVPLWADYHPAQVFD